MRPINLLFIPCLLVFGLLLLNNRAEADTDACAKHLKSTCTSCHSNDVACQRLGNPVKEWQGILSQMRLNGAELGKAGAEALAICLSQPSASAKAACAK